MALSPMSCTLMLARSTQPGALQNDPLNQSNVCVSPDAFSSDSFPTEIDAGLAKMMSFLDHVLTLITPLSDLGKPSKEQLVLQMELRRLQNARRMDEEEFDNQKQVLQAQLQSEVSSFTASH